jgi:hypothetical protein
MVRDASGISFDKGTVTIATVCNGSQQFAKLARLDDAEIGRDEAFDAQEGP